MAVVTEKQFIQQIKSGEIANLYFVYGEEDYIKNLHSRRLAKKLVPEGDASFNLSRFDMTKTDVLSIAESVEELPVFAPVRCVYVTNVNPETINAADLKQLKSILADIPATTVLLLVAADHCNNFKAAKWKAFIELINKNGICVCYEKRNRSSICKFISERVAKNGSSISPQLCGYIIDYCSDEIDTLIQETDKLAAYARGREITKEDLDLLLTHKLDATVYELSKAMLKRNYDTCFSKLEELFAQRVDEIIILSTLSGAFIDLYRAKAALTANISQAAVVSDFAYKNLAFRMKNAFYDCGAFSMAFLRQSISLCAQTDIKMKSSQANKQILLQQLIAQLIVLQK